MINHFVGQALMMRIIGQPLVDLSTIVHLPAAGTLVSLLAYLANGQLTARYSSSPLPSAHLPPFLHGHVCCGIAIRLSADRCMLRESVSHLVFFKCLIPRVDERRIIPDLCMGHICTAPGKFMLMCLLKFSITARSWARLHVWKQ